MMPRTRRSSDWDKFRYENHNGNGHTAVGATAKPTRYIAAMEYDGTDLKVEFKSDPFDPLMRRTYSYPSNSACYAKENKRQLDAGDADGILNAVHSYGVTDAQVVKQLCTDLGLPTGTKRMRPTLSGEWVEAKSNGIGYSAFSRSPLSDAGAMGGRRNRSGGRTGREE